ncbi:hypothetical protein ACSS6W_000616 [Trichoderma asperelloides]
MLPAAPPTPHPPSSVMFQAFTMSQTLLVGSWSGYRCLGMTSELDTGTHIQPEPCVSLRLYVSLFR